MQLAFCVLTMVTRDDLTDGGAAHMVRTIQAIRTRCPNVGVEVLISDLGGNGDSLRRVLAAEPEVLNHNIETVPRLYPQVRPQARYQRSLKLLASAAGYGLPTATKSGLMLGLGETQQEVLNVLDDLRAVGCQLLTLGQYLAPSSRHHSVVRYVTPEEFAEYKREALIRGFKGVASAPLVRSSYQAEQLYKATRDFPTD
jgi:lipoic acid synthetase